MILRRHSAAGVESEAAYSECGLYRYALTRIWDPAAPRLAWVMLNPSTASETRNDPTVERCARRARAMGCGGFRVVNLFAFRATDPRDLMRAADPIGPENDAALAAAMAWADLVVCGWGAHGGHLGRGARVAAALSAHGPLWALGLTRDGHPRHPLYVGYAVQPQPWDANR